MKPILLFQKSASLLGTIAIIALSLTGIIWLQLSRIQPQSTTLTPTEYQQKEQLEKLQLDVFKGLPALGFDNLLADWLYLRFIQYFGDGEARKQTGYALSANYLELVAERDPLFIDALLKLAGATSIFAGEPKKTITALEKSLVLVPAKLDAPVYPPYYLWLYKGIDELLFLGDTKAAQKSYTMASNWAQTYDDEVSQSLAARTKDTVKFLQKNPKSKIAQIGAWSMVLSSTADVKTQQRALQEIQALGGKILVSPEGQISIVVPKEVE